MGKSLVRERSLIIRDPWWSSANLERPVPQLADSLHYLIHSCLRVVPQSKPLLIDAIDAMERRLATFRYES